MSAPFERRVAWLTAPMIAAIVVLVAVPFIGTIVLAFTHYDALHAPRAAGLENFRRLIGDDIFRLSLTNSLIFAAMAVPARLLAATGTALLLARRRRGVVAVRGLTYLPSVVPDIAYALLWLWVFNPLYGPLGHLLHAVGLPGTEWLLGPWGARVSVVILTVFQIGEGFLVALAARNDIPGELYELAELERASPWYTLTHVTLPMMAPVLVLLAARDVAFSFQLSFVPGLVLTEGGPFYATTFLPLYTYQNAFGFLRFGYASAMTLVMWVVTGAMIGVAFLAVRRWRAASLAS